MNEEFGKEKALFAKSGSLKKTVQTGKRCRYPDGKAPKSGEAIGPVAKNIRTLFGSLSYDYFFEQKIGGYFSSFNIYR